MTHPNKNDRDVEVQVSESGANKDIRPGHHTAEFLRQVERMEDVLRDISGLLLVAGDFNARAIE